MKNIYSKIGKLLGEWRRAQGYSLYKIAKEGPGNVRYDSLKRIEKGDVVSSETLLCYVDFCYHHGFRIFDEIYNNISLQQCNVAKKEQICEAKKEVIEDVQTPSMVEEPEPEEDDFAPSEQDEDYLFAENAFDDKKPMTEQDQIAFIRHHRCPRCGSELREKEGKYGAYIGCVRWNAPNDRCEYTASGTFASFTISKKFKPVVTTVKEIMEGQASLSMGNKPRQEREKRQS